MWDPFGTKHFDHFNQINQQPMDSKPSYKINRDYIKTAFDELSMWPN